MQIDYFTGTGNSYWAAKKIGEYFSAEVHSIMDFVNVENVVVDDDAIGIVCPTYMSDIPWIVKDFLLKLSSPANSIMKRFKVKKHCNGCGVCAEVCPMGNISVSSERAAHGKNCAACYACIHWCPEHATIVNAPIFRGLRQYHHPEVTLDIMTGKGR